MNPSKLDEMLAEHRKLEALRNNACWSSHEDAYAVCLNYGRELGDSSRRIGNAVVAGRRQGEFRESKFNDVASTALKAESCHSILKPIRDLLGIGPKLNCGELSEDLTRRVGVLAKEIDREETRALGWRVSSGGR